MRAALCLACVSHYAASLSFGGDTSRAPRYIVSVLSLTMYRL
jgi:hypothetical protein